MRREFLGIAGSGLEQIEDEKNEGKKVREISPEGFDKRGNFCYWVGFDKINGKFFGKPKGERHGNNK